MRQWLAFRIWYKRGVLHGQPWWLRVREIEQAIGVLRLGSSLWDDRYLE